MAKYEVMYIVRASVDEEGLKAVNTEMQAAFTSNGATVLECKELGLKELAYEIDGEKKGFYMWYEVEANSAACNEFVRRANISEVVIRQIVVKEDK